MAAGHGKEGLSMTFRCEACGGIKACGVCNFCGKALLVGQVKWCSRGCSQEGLAAERRDKAAARRAAPRQCLDCGGAFHVQETRGPLPKRCAPCRDERRAARKRKKN
jgi:hypothetical protein